MEGFSNADQLYDLFLSGGLGMLLGVYYDVFRLWRLLSPCRRLTVFFQDVVFFATAAVITFLFDMTMSGGQLRFYLFVGMGCGFWVYRLTFGKAVGYIAVWLRRFLSCVMAWCRRWIGRPLTIVWRLFGKLWGRLSEKSLKTAKKVGYFLKKGLKRGVGLLYNQECERVSISDTERMGEGVEGNQRQYQKTEKSRFADSHFGFLGIRSRHDGATADGDRPRPKTNGRNRQRKRSRGPTNRRSAQ